MDEIIKGFLKVETNGEEDILKLYTSKIDSEPIAEIFENKLVNKLVTVSYYTSDIEMSLEELQEEYLKKLYGKVEAKYNIFYSAITGYLWTTERLKIGGHDILNELYSYADKYLTMLITVHDERKIANEEN